MKSVVIKDSDGIGKSQVEFDFSYGEASVYVTQYLGAYYGSYDMSFRLTDEQVIDIYNIASKYLKDKELI